LSGADWDRAHVSWGDVRSLWIASTGPKGTSYRINRDHPALAAFAAGLSEKQKEFNAVLALIEQTVPVERIWLDVSESEGASRSMDDDEIEQLTSSFIELAKILPTSLAPSERVDLLLRNLPQPPMKLRKNLLEILGAAA